MVQRYSTGSTLAAYSLTLVTVEMPPLYAGDSVSSTANVAGGTLTGFSSVETSYSTLLHFGDVIRFNFQGRTYMLTGGTWGQPLTLPATLVATDNSGVFAPPMTNAQFQVFRQPVKSVVPPLQLPDGAVVDLSNSGVGLTGLFSGAAPYQSTVVSFSPKGSVEFVYDGSTIYHPATTIYLLIGRRDGMSDVNTNTSSLGQNPQNPYDLNNLWVSIAPTSGRVVTAENANTALGNARSFAQTSQSMGGK